MGKIEVHKDGGDDGRVSEKGEDLHGAAAGRTEERQDLVDSGEEHGPADTRGAGWARRLVQRAGGERCGLGVGDAERVGRSSTDGDDGGAQAGMGRQNAVVAVAVHPGRGHESDEALEELERREDDLGAPVGPTFGGCPGFGEAVEQARVGRREGGDTGKGMESLEREGWAGTIAQEALEAGTVVTLDAHGGALPHAMHASRGGPASMLNPPDPCHESMSRVSSSSRSP